MNMSALNGAVTAITKRANALNAMTDSPDISRSHVNGEDSYRHQIAGALAKIHGEVQALLRYKELYLSATDSLFS